jgi:hypothetical protein
MPPVEVIAMTRPERWLTHDGQHSPGGVQRAEKIRLNLCPEVTRG